MKKITSFVFPVMAVLFAIVCIFTGHHAHAIFAVTPMLGAQDMRLAYINAYRSLAKAAGNNPALMPNTANRVLSQSFLRSEVLINPNKTSYQVGINVNQIYNGQQTIYQEENRLNLQDMFFVSQIGYYLRVLSTTGGNTTYSNQLFTHFPGQFYGSTGIDLNQTDALWNGTLNLSVNNRTIVNSWDLWRHREVPETQYPVFSSTVAGEQYPVNDEQCGSQSGMYPVEPMWVLDGSLDNQMQLLYNEALNNVIPTTFTVHMVILMRGILAQNCGKIMEAGILPSM